MNQDEIHPLDKLFVQWYKQNRGKFSSWVETLDDAVSYFGWPSEWKPEPYVEDLVHVLESGEEELGVPFPKELTAHALSVWAGSKVPVDHPLVQNSDKWQNVVLDGEHNMASPADEKQLWILLNGIATGEAKKNLGSFQDLSDHLDLPEYTGKIYTVRTDGGPISFVITDEVVAFMHRETGQVKVFDYDGNQIQRDIDHSKTAGYIQGVPGGVGNMIEPGALASIIGNTLAHLVTGDIELFDLP